MWMECFFFNQLPFIDVSAVMSHQKNLLEMDIITKLAFARNFIKD